MPKSSCLQFENYSVEKLSYENIPMDSNTHDFELCPNFHNQLIDTGGNKFDVRLAMNIEPTDDHPLPFRLAVSIVGHFSYSDDSHIYSESQKDEILRHNTVAILFPFLRSIVASLTASANIPPLIIPIINLSQN